MSANPTIIHGSHSDIGLTRAENQDSCGAFGHLFLVADGMGGHKGGREASRLAVEIIRDAFQNSSDGPIDETLRSAFQQANNAIYLRSQQTPFPTTMGSTCTALAFANDTACIAHVGDSRAYRVTRAGAQQLTDDHSTVGEMQRLGLLGKEAARMHPERSQITRALGVKPDVEVDIIGGIPLIETNDFLLCTDGLSNAVSDAEIHDIVLAHPPQEACRILVELANARGGEDNVTAQAVHVERHLTFREKLTVFFQAMAGRKMQEKSPRLR